jgi:hypothetical protein
MKYHSKACSTWLKALLPNHLTQTASGKLLGVVFLPSGWDGEIRVSDDGLHVLITSITPKVIINAKMLLSRQNVDKQNVFVDYLQGAMDKKKQQDHKQTKRHFG